MVPVSAMVQVSERVGMAQKGSMKAVAGSAIASMSEASMDFQPRMEEPSKPKPSVKTSSFSSEMGQLKCCPVPKVSTNLMSTILAPCFLAISITLLGLLMDCFFWGFSNAAAPAGLYCLVLARTAGKNRVPLSDRLVASGLRTHALFDSCETEGRGGARPRHMPAHGSLVVGLFAVLGQI